MRFIYNKIECILLIKALHFLLPPMFYVFAIIFYIKENNDYKGRKQEKEKGTEKNYENN